MNRKIIYLLTGLLLACFTTMAGVIDQTIKLKLGANEGMYQIVSSKCSGRAIVLEADGKIGTAEIASLDASTYAKSLWVIHVDGYDQGQAPKFDFTNKMYGYLLDIAMEGDMGDALGHNISSPQLSVGGNINGWAFSSTSANGVETDKPLFSYYKTDSVVVLKLDKDKNAIVGVKLGANEVKTVTEGDPAFRFSLKKPEHITLNAEALNTMLGVKPKDTSFNLKFKEEANPNVLANELMAHDTTGNGLSGYVTLTNKETGNYIRVDTSYTDVNGTSLIQLTDTTTVESYAKATASGGSPADLGTSNYLFKFEYAPASDSLYITVKGAILTKEDKPWSESAVINDNTDSDTLHIYIHNLESTNYLTVGKDTTKITLDLSNYVATVTKTTIPSNLYVIKNTDGQYLSVPLDGDTAVQWVTLDKYVNVWAMPSFQWVVEMDVNSSPYSPIKITNREFPDVYKTNIRLDKEIPFELIDSKSVRKDIMPDGFIAASVEVKADSCLGYKSLDADEIQKTQYKFRKLDESSDKSYIGINTKENDPGLYNGSETAFVLQRDGTQEENYGYTSKKVFGLKPLVRNIYTLKTYNAKQIADKQAKNVILNNQGQYIISDSDTPAKFLLRASNEKTIDGKEITFYTFIGIGTNEGDTVKVGIDDTDQSLIGQQMNESSAAAFSVEVFKIEASLSSEAPVVNDWYTKPVTLTAPGGYIIALKNNSNYAPSFVWDTEGSNNVAYSLKPDGVGSTIEKTVTIKLDQVDPEISASVDGLDFTLSLSDQADGSGVARLYIDGNEVRINAGATSYSSTGSPGIHTAVLLDGAGRSATVEFTLAEKPGPVYYTVILPALVGILTDPPANSYDVKSGDTFEFRLAFENGYFLHSKPVVKVNGTTIQPRAVDGKYVIQDIQEDKTIKIEGIVRDDAVANMLINADIHIRAVGRAIYISLPTPQDCRLTDLSGKIIRQLQLIPGENCIDGLKTGIYILNLGNLPGVKVICKD